MEQKSLHPELLHKLWDPAENKANFYLTFPNIMAGFLYRPIFSTHSHIHCTFYYCYGCIQNMPTFINWTANKTKKKNEIIKLNYRFCFSTKSKQNINSLLALSRSTWKLFCKITIVYCWSNDFDISKCEAFSYSIGEKSQIS